MSTEALEIRVRGRVQGVGFRPAVWRLARDLSLAGEVLNDGLGVLIRVRGPREALDALLQRLEREQPPLARIEAIESRPFDGVLREPFQISESVAGAARTEVAPDAAICPACALEIADPSSRRHRYPFTTCTHCGPRLTMVTAVPYDRANTTMAGFELCPACATEYRDPGDRRFHAESTACVACGPTARLVRLDGLSFESTLDPIDAVAELIERGEIVAIKGLGGFHLACDATDADAVARLRASKHREARPFALMARDLEVIRAYCTVRPDEAEALASPAAPVVLLDADGPRRLPEAIAPGLKTLGFMLPTTPLHALILKRFTTPVVMTSGNLSDEPQVTRDDDARARLASIASHALLHDREIANRVDDSVVRRIGGRMRTLRRARGFAPGALPLPEGFERAPELLAYGAHLKSTFCLVRNGAAILSQHQGDLEDVRTLDDYRKNLRLFTALFDHRPVALAADAHPAYQSTLLAQEHAERTSLPLARVLHHHAHVASCLAENGRPLSAPPVLGIALDGLGYGDDGELWGGEFLLADYARAQRVATFKPVALLGGDQAGREPWRNLYAHLMAELGWAELTRRFSALPLHAELAAKPRAALDVMLRDGLHSPKASSCGRLFEAVAAALGLCRDRQAYEGEAACRLEVIVDRDALANEDERRGYPFGAPSRSGLPTLEPLEAWSALLEDLSSGTSPGVISARFHRGLAEGIAQLTVTLAATARFDTVALTGGCFQNRVLFEEVERRLLTAGFTVLSHSQVPAGDGGLALGQAAIASARWLTPVRA